MSEPKIVQIEVRKVADDSESLDRDSIQKLWVVTENALGKNDVVYINWEGIRFILPPSAYAWFVASIANYFEFVREDAAKRLHYIGQSDNMISVMVSVSNLMRERGLWDKKVKIGDTPE